MIAGMPSSVLALPKKNGLAFWMEQVLAECKLASVSFAPDPVHDLRVALRRCRSMADGMMAIDPDPSWKQMKKAGKRVFSSLGELRDAHVMEEWIHKLDTPGDPVTSTLLDFLATRERKFKEQAAQALQEFDPKQWKKWAKQLPRRAARVRPGSAIFQHLALERWVQAQRLHQRALRYGSPVAFHDLRIGIKRFRYIVENFLPQQHDAWGSDLKNLQDQLGDVHDLDVLWETALQINAFPDEDSRLRWHEKIHEKREQKLDKYRNATLGDAGLWQSWRDALPKGKEIQEIGLHRLRLWASVLDPDFRGSTHAAKLALQLYDQLALHGYITKKAFRNGRSMLQLAALMRDVGRSRRDKGHQKSSYRLIGGLTPPLGWSRKDLALAAIVARYHRGALPRASHPTLHGLAVAQRREVMQLAGILRLANAFDSARDGHIQKLEVHPENNFLVIAASGYAARDRSTETIASARHLLETVYRRPILVKPLLLKRQKLAR